MQKIYAIYRVSTTGQGRDEKSGIPTQKRIIEQYCSKHNIEITAEVQDIGISAGDLGQFDRGNLGKLLTKIKAKPIAAGSVALIFAFPDRLSRADISQAMGKFFELNQLGIDIIFADTEMHIKANSEKSMGELVTVMSYFDQANIYWKNAQRRTAGVWEKWRNDWINFTNGVTKKRPSNNLMGKVRWWQKIDEETNEVINDSEKIPIVKKIFDLFTEKNLAIQAIAHKLNEEGIERQSQYKRKKKYENRDGFQPVANWLESGIRETLVSRETIGEKPFFKTEKVGGVKRVTPCLDDDGKPLIIPNFIKGKPIISKARFFKAQKFLDKNAHHKGKKTETVNIFRSLLTDGYHNLPMQMTGNMEGFKSLRPVYPKNHNSKAKSKSISLQNFEKSFFTSYKLLHYQSEIAVLWNSATEDSHKNDLNEIAVISDQIKQLRTANENLTTAIVTAQSITVIQTLTEKLDANQNEIESLKKKSKALESKTNKIVTNEIKTDLEALRHYSKNTTLREKAWNYLYSTEHKIYAFGGGIKFNKAKMLKKLGKLYKPLGVENNWDNFDWKTFQHSPMYFLNAYIFFKFFYPKINIELIKHAYDNPNFSIEILYEFFGKKDLLPATHNTKIFLCQLSDGRQFSTGYSVKQRHPPTLKFTSFGRGFQTFSYRDRYAEGSKLLERDFDFTKPKLNLELTAVSPKKGVIKDFYNELFNIMGLFAEAHPSKAKSLAMGSLRDTNPNSKTMAWALNFRQNKQRLEKNDKLKDEQLFFTEKSVRMFFPLMLDDSDFLKFIEVGV